MWLLAIVTLLFVLDCFRRGCLLRKRTSKDAMLVYY